GPVGGGGVIAQRRVARDRALSVTERRWPAVARHPRHRAQGQDRCRGRRRAHGCAHLRPGGSPLGRHPAPGRRAAAGPAYLPADAKAMTMRGGRLLRRWLSAFALASSLLATA